MSVPEVSVVMGVGGDAEGLQAKHGLQETLQSVLLQEGPSLEFLVVPNGPHADKLAEGLRRIEDKRLRILPLAEPGLTKALWYGCREARGAFIARQDCADLSLPGRLSLQVECLARHAEVGFVSCGVRYEGPGGEFLREAGTDPAGEVPQRILDPAAPHGVRGGPTHHGAVMFRRDLYQRVGGYREEFLLGQDWDLWYRMAEVAWFANCSRTLYVARLGLSSLSFVARDWQQAFAECSREARRLRLAGQSEEPALVRARDLRERVHPRQQKGVAEGAYHVGSLLEARGDVACRKYLWLAVREKPTWVAAWLKLVRAILWRRGA